MPRTHASAVASTVVGQEIKRARGEAGLTQAELARRLDVSPSYISNIEAGRVNVTVGQLGERAQRLGEEEEDDGRSGEERGRDERTEPLGAGVGRVTLEEEDDDDGGRDSRDERVAAERARGRGRRRHDAVEHAQQGLDRPRAC